MAAIERVFTSVSAAPMRALGDVVGLAVLGGAIAGLFALA